MHNYIHTHEQKVLTELLKDSREKAGVTQQELADRLGTTQSIVSKIERGERRVDLLELLRILRAVGADEIIFIRKLRSQLGVLQKGGGKL